MQTQTPQREYRRNNEGRWFYRETETYSSGRTYTNYYMQSQPSEGREDSLYGSTTEENWNNQNWQ